ncbi:MAG TPA: RecQ family ATP-dependent DNA helicase [Cytophagales bacterium]|nr:RecQ family ATP-dependent DNA helicase [Cytophagales bacterium]
MKQITFIDLEIEPKSRKILDIGAVKSSTSTFHKNSVGDFIHFLNGSDFIAGHNIFNHDLKYLDKYLNQKGRNNFKVVDTLYLSPLLFPKCPYHALPKDDKLQTEELNNPLNDSIKAKDLFFEEVSAFQYLDDNLKQIFYLLLRNKKEFSAFFDYLEYNPGTNNLETVLRESFNEEICGQAGIGKMILENPIELAYCLALIHVKDQYSITPRWVMKLFPEVERLMYLLRNKPCISGCAYCNQSLDIYKGLKGFFGFDNYRSYGGEPLQANAVKAAVNSKSILAIFPTGGGKSITFQVPALMSGKNAKGLTVVISPLQSLMKDQVDNLEKNGIVEAVTINGLLDPIERAKSYERVENGSASMLYISPESLRSKTIERLLLGRNVVRFVIDEAHCFSSWGQDFRVDYLYIGDFIKSLQEKKNLLDPIPVSCFTATAKQKVIEDIRSYFKEKLSIEVFRSKASRTNLQYKVYQRGNEEDKYNQVRDLVEEKNCPTIVYVSRTRKAYTLAERLTQDGFVAKPYHGKMDAQEKTANQNAFVVGEVPIMVATSAFGMGVDKKDVGMVIHYEISDSLENYIQEAGRAGRDESLSAECFVLFDEEDLSKHFILLNQTKLHKEEINQVWQAIKELTKFRSKVSNSALEIARKAGWDENVQEIETRVTTAIAALEDSGYLKRGQNVPRIFANSILSKNAQEAIDKINASGKFDEKQKEKGIRIIKKLFSSKSKKSGNDEEGESRIDYIAESLGIVKEEVIKVISLLRDEKILADQKDLTAFIKKGENKNRSLKILESYLMIESFLLPLMEEKEKTFNLKVLNESAESEECVDVTPNKIKTVLNFWAVKNWIKRKKLDYSKNDIVILSLQPVERLKEKLKKRSELARYILDYLFQKSKLTLNEEEREEVLVEFSVHQLKEAYENSSDLFKIEVTLDDIEDTLFYLSRIETIKIEGGFLVVYNRLTIDRLQLDNRKQYKFEDYEKLKQFYENKVQQIHIVGEYAKKMVEDYKGALQFVDDYFQLNYNSFLNKYFNPARQKEIRNNITPTKFKQLFGDLSERQLSIIKDKDTPYAVVAAGPGSGKTKLLVHKLASMLLMEDVKHEQLLMITFSRAAATEFKKRLRELIGNAAHYVDIKTFHSYCFDLLGKVGSLEKSDIILKKAIEKIRNKEIEVSGITKTVLVIDEAQDMNEDEFALILELMQHNDQMRVIAVGDDDQNIYEFRGASSKYLFQFINEKKALKHELVENFRSKSNLVDFSNQFVKQIRNRLKENPIQGKKKEKGKIRIVKYKSPHLITPLVNDILRSELTGSTCVLTNTNDDAFQLAGLLVKRGLKSKLIQSNDAFNLYNLAEVRFFLSRLNIRDDTYFISDECWERAKRELVTQYSKSSKLEICKNIVKEFEAVNNVKKYKTDLEVFIREFKLEDFINQTGETIVVSTIHKAKGREFDNVFLMLPNFNCDWDEGKRLLYVGMTRAKENLIIHLNGSYLDFIEVDGIERIEDHGAYSEPDSFVMQLSFKDVFLDYFFNKQNHLSSLKGGDELKVNGIECFNSQGQPVLRFSKQFLNVVEGKKQQGFVLKSAKVNFIVYWKGEGMDQEVKVVLPEVEFVREKVT